MASIAITVHSNYDIYATILNKIRSKKEKEIDIGHINIGVISRDPKTNEPIVLPVNVESNRRFLKLTPDKKTDFWKLFGFR